MEFYKEVAAHWEIEELQKTLSIENLSRLCPSIDKVIEAKGNQGEIYCLWGQFRINREPIKKGIRFSLPYCPNALAWSITREEEEQQLLIHCTINKSSHEMEFIDSIHEFINDWQEGLERYYSSIDNGMEKSV